MSSSKPANSWRAALEKRRLALGVYALATLLAFPHEVPGLGSIDFGLVFVWWVPAALVIGLDRRSPRDAARVAFLASLVGHVLLFHWFYVVTVSYGGMSWWLGVLSPLVPAIYVSLFTSLFAAGWAKVRGPGLPSVLLGAALWVSVDWARAHFLGGFPWATLGYALHQDIPLLGLTRATGVYGLSFVAVCAGIALAQVAVGEGRSRVRGLVLVVVCLILLHLGLGLRPASERSSQEMLRIAAVQGNIDQGEKWDEARRQLIFEKYLGLSQQAVEQGAKWVVWPETAVPGFLELDAGFAERLVEFSSSHDVVLVVGGMGVAPDETGQRIGAFFDSAFVFDRSGRLVDRYDKSHLVPFGEFVPFRDLLGRFFEALATGLSSADVTPGERPRVLRWSDPEIDDSKLRVATPICYELLFPHLVRRFGEDGADILLAITNDAWYGRTGAPHQFLAMTSMRAAENGRFLVRAANTGISGIIDDHGRVRESTALFEDALVVADVPIPRRPNARTFYAKHGDVFAAFCALVSVLGLGRMGLRDRQRRRGNGISAQTIGDVESVGSLDRESRMRSPGGSAP